MTVTVETPEGLKIGSAVREISNSEAGAFPPEAGNPGKLRGEAVVVDLGKRGVLFALVSHDSDNRFSQAFPLPGRSGALGSTTLEGIQYHASLPVGTKGIVDPTSPYGYPKLVTFTDNNDPKSVTLAQIWERQKNGRYALKEDRMEELFGKGVKLKDITLEITNEPVTWGVEKKIPWLREYYNKRLDGNRYGTSKAINKTANALSAGAFSTGEPK